MRRLPLLNRFRRNEDGATLVEFAFVAPVVVLMLIGGMDIGYSIYIRSVANGALESVARSGSLEGATESQIRFDIRKNVKTILPDFAAHDANVVVTTKNYTDYSRIKAAEKIVVDHDNDGVLDPPETSDVNGNGKIDTGDCWIDEDGNNQYGTNEGKDGIGGADDSVYYNVAITVPNLFPMTGLLGLPSTRVINVKTLVVNQPYGQQATRPTVCRTV